MFSNLKNYLALILLALIISFPLGLWLFAGPPIVLTTPSLLFKTLGQSLAIVGVTLLVTEFILSARFRWVEALLSGLNRVYVWHHLIGGIALISLLFHPIFLSVQYLFISVISAAQFLLPPFSQIEIWLGISALMTMILLLILTFFIRLKYETWKSTHQWLGIVLILAFFHTLLVPGILLQNQGLKIYLIGLYLIGIGCYLYQVIIKRFMKKNEYQVISLVSLPDNVLEITLTPQGKSLNFQAGQFVFIETKSPGLPKETHPFSLISSPKDSNLQLAIKNLGDFTGQLSTLKIGDPVNVEGPYGRFTLQEFTNPNQIWVAGGIGITPFISFLKSINPNSAPAFVEVWLYYSVKTAVEASFLTEIKTLISRLPYFKFVLHESASAGRLTYETIITPIANPHAFDLLICGPGPMMTALSRQARQNGLPGAMIHTEAFQLYE